MTNQSENHRGFPIVFLALLWKVRSVILGILLLVVVGAAFIAWDGYHDGEHSFFNALYLSFITALTIGYGDLTPDGPVGKVTAIVLGALGIVLMGIIVGAVIKALERSM